MGDRSSVRHIDISYQNGWTPDLSDVSIYLRGPWSDPGTIISQYNDNLIHCYNFDDKVSTVVPDSVGPNEGSASGQTRFGYYGMQRGGTRNRYAAEFDGENDEINVGSDLLGSSFTISAWIYININTTRINSVYKPGGYRSQDEHVVFSQTNNYFDKFWFGCDVGSDSGRLFAAVADIGGFGVLRSDLPVADDYWHLLVVTVDEREVKLYVDGALENYTTFTRDPPSGTCRIGSFGGEGFFQGRMQDVYLWDTAISEEAILDLYGDREGFKSYTTRGRTDYGNFYDYDFLWRHNPGWSENLSANDINLKAVYRCEEEPKDLPQDSKGTYHAETSTIHQSYYQRRGKAGRSFYLDNNYYFRVPRMVQDDFTVSFWMKTDSMDSWTLQSHWYTGHHIISTGDVNTNLIWSIFQSRGKLGFTMGDPLWTVMINGNTPDLPDGQWHHIAVSRVKESGHVKIFIDGFKWWDGYSSNRNSLTGRDYIYFGRSGDSGDSTRAFHGDLDEIYFWDVELEDADISELYNGGTGKFYGVSEYTQRRNSLYNYKDNLVSVWALDNGLINDSVWYNHGIIEGSPTLEVTGKIDKAIEFYGLSTDYLDFQETNSDITPTGTDYMSFSVWVYGIDWNDPDTTNFILEEYSTGNDYKFRAYINTSGTVTVMVNATVASYGRMYFTSTGTPLSEGEWHHIVFTIRFYKYDYARFYIDGELDTEIEIDSGGNYEGTFVQSTYNYQTRMGQYFNGRIEQFCIWNERLSLEAIVDLYNSGSGLALDRWYVPPGKITGVMGGEDYSVIIKPKTPWPSEGNTVQVRVSPVDSYTEGDLIVTEDGSSWDPETDKDTNCRIFVDGRAQVISEIREDFYTVGAEASKANAIGQSFKTTDDGVLDKLEVYFASESGGGPGICLVEVYEGSDPDTGTLMGYSEFVPEANKWNHIPTEIKSFGTQDLDSYRSHHIGSFTLKESSNLRANMVRIDHLFPEGNIGNARGMIGQAAYFIGGAGGLIMDQERFIDTHFTISMIFKTENNSRNQVLLSKGESDLLDSIRLTIGDGKVVFDMWESDRTRRTIQSDIDSETVYVIVLTSDGFRVAMCLNGVEVGEIDFEGTLFREGQNDQMRIGEYFLGWIQHFNYWDAPLSAGAISDLYNNGEGRAYGNQDWMSLLSASDGGLVSVYQLEDGIDPINGNTLGNENGAIFEQGKYQNGVSLNPLYDRRLSVYSEDFNLNGDRTISAWIKPSTISSFSHEALDPFDQYLVAVWPLDGSGEELINGLDLGSRYNEDDRFVRWGGGINNLGLSMYRRAPEAYGCSPLNRSWDHKLEPDHITVSIWARRNYWDPGRKVMFSLRSGVLIGTQVGNVGDCVVSFRRAGNWINLYYPHGNLVRWDHWHHFVFTYDGTNARLYIDGELKDEDAEGENTPLDYGSITTWVGVGYNVDNDDYWFDQDGWLDEIYLWDEAISADAVSALYNDGLGRFFTNASVTGVVTKGDHSDTDTAQYGLALAPSGAISGWLYGEADLKWNSKLSEYDDNLIAVWPLQESCDKFMNILNGKISMSYGKTKTLIEGISKRSSVGFDGATSYIDCGKEDYLRPSTGITYSFWVRPEIMLDQYRQVVGNLFYDPVGGNHRGIGINLGPEGLQWVAHGQYNTQYSFLYCIANIGQDKQGEWFHVVATQTQGESPDVRTIYINGVETSHREDGMPNMGADFETSFRMGMMEYGGTEYFFPGVLHDVYVWDTALDQDAVTALYNEGYGRFYDPQESSLNPPLVLNGTADSSSDYPQLYKAGSRLPRISDVRLFYDGALSRYNGVHKSPEGTNYIVRLWPSSDKLVIFERDNVQCLSYNGSTGYLSVSPALALKPSSLSLSVWIRPDSLKDCGIAICRVDLDADAANWQLELESDGDVKFSWYDTISSTWKSFGSSSQPVAAGVWSHIAVSYDGPAGTGKIYVDGSEEASGTTLPQLDTTHSGYVQIGRGEYGYFEGLIDELYLWNTDIDQNAIDSLYNYGHGKYYRFGHVWRSELRSNDANLEAVYHFEEEAGDYLDEINSHTMLRSGSVSRGVDGIRDKCVEFDGIISNYLYIPASENVRYDELTISLWIKADTWTDFRTYIDTYSQDTVTGGDGLFIQHRGTNPIKFAMFFRDAGMVEYSIEADSVLSDTDDFHHLAVTWDSSTMKMYVDGVLQADTELTNDPNIDGFTSSTQWDIGRYSLAGSGQYAFDGKMDELYFWEDTLDASQISELYNNGIGRFYNRHQEPDITWTRLLQGSDDNIISAWKFRDNGSQCKDMIGSNNGSVESGSSVGEVGIGDDPCYSFNGTSGHVDLSSNSEIIPSGTARWTISLWVHGNQWGQDDSTSCLFYESTSSDSSLAKFVVDVDTSGLVSAAYRDAPAGSLIDLGTAGGSYALPVDDWAQILVTVDTVSGTAKIYVDGQIADTTSFTGASICASASAKTKTIGARTPLVGGSSQHFDGKIDELYIWSEVLSSGKISDLYNSGYGRFFEPDLEWDSNLSAFDSDLIAIWHFEEDSGTLYEEVAGRDATANGTVTYSRPGRGMNTSYWELQPDQTGVVGTWDCTHRTRNGTEATSGGSVVTASHMPLRMPAVASIDFSSDVTVPALSGSEVGLSVVDLHYDTEYHSYSLVYNSVNGDVYDLELDYASAFLRIKRRGSDLSRGWEFEPDSSVLGDWSCIRRSETNDRQEAGPSSSISVSGTSVMAANQYSPVYRSWNALSDRDLIVEESWYHLSYRVDMGTSASVYIDGQEIVSTDLTEIQSSHAAAPVGPLFIGGYEDKIVDADIDETYVWSTDLPEDRVLDLYDRGRGRFYSFDSSWIGPIVNRDRDIISAWKLGEPSGTRVDELGLYDLTDVNFVKSEPGVRGWCAKFVLGSSTYLYNDSATGLGTTQFTVSLWVTTGMTNGSGCLLGFEDIDALYGWRIIYDSDIRCLRFKFGLGSSSEEFLVSIEAASDWAHIVLAVDGTSIKVYINNVEKLEATLSTDISYSSTTIISIGASYHSADYDSYFDGKIDELYIWGVPLNADEVYFLYNSGAGRFYETSDDEWPESLEEYNDHFIVVWKMEEESGDRDPIVGTYVLEDNNTVGSGVGRFGVRAASFLKSNFEFLSISTADAPDLNIGNSFTISLWVRLRTTTTDWDYPLVSKWGVGEMSYRLVSDLGTDKIRFDVSASGAWDGTYLQSTRAVHVGTWHHIAVTHNGSILRLFIDGNEEDSLAYTSTARASMRPFEVGAVAESGEYLDGDIDELYLWDTPLPEALINVLSRSHYDIHTTWTEKLRVYNQNLVSAWSFDEVSGTPYDSVMDRHLGFSSISRTEGINGNAVQFTGGLDSYLIYPETQEITRNLSGLTASFWMKLTSTPTKDCYVIIESTDKIGTSNAISRFYITVKYSNLALLVSMRDDSSASPKRAASTEAFVVGEIYHVFVSVDTFNNRIKAFVNGDVWIDASVSMGRFDEAPSLFPAYFGVRLAYDGVPQYGFTGWLDEFYIWNKALSKAESDELYNDGFGRFYEPSDVTLRAKTDYNFTIVCDPYPSLWTYSYITIRVKEIEGGRYYTAKDGVWESHEGSSADMRIWINGVAEIQVLEGGSEDPLGRIGSGTYAVGQVFTTGTTGGVISKIEVECSRAITDGLGDIRLELREGSAIGEGDLVAEATLGSINAPGWFAFHNFSAPADTSWSSALRDSDDSLVAAWKLDEASGTAFDLKSDNDLTANGTLGVTGKELLGRYFDLASSEYLYRASSDLTKSIDAVTLSCWVKPDSVAGATAEQTIFWEGSSLSGSARFSVGISPAGKLFIRIKDDSASSFYKTSSSSFTDGEWYHIAVAIDTNDDEIRALVNNEIWIDADETLDIFHSGASVQGLRVGASVLVSEQAFFGGIIDEMYLWTTRLSNVALEDLYNYGLGRFYSLDRGWTQTLSTFDENSISIWNLDEIEGSRFDSKAFNHLESINGVQGESARDSFVATFDPGSEQYLRVTRGNYRNLSMSGSFSLFCWVKPYVYANQTIINKGNGTDSNYLLRMTSSGYLQSRLQRDPAGYSTVTSSSVIPLNEWSLIGVVYNQSATLHRIYIDTVLVGSIALGTALRANELTTFSIGAQTDGSNNPFEFFSGQISTTYLWDTTISSAAMDDLYNEGIGRNYEAIDRSWTEGLDGYRSSLVSVWKFEEESGLLRDSVGQSHGEKVGTVTVESAFDGFGITVDGTTGYIDCGNSTTLDLRTAFTFAAWIKPSRNWGTILSKGDISAGNLNYSFLLDGGNFRFESWDGVTGYTQDFDLEIDVGQWNFVVLTYDGGELTVYKNSEKEARAYTHILTTDSEPLYIGARKSGASIVDPFKGTIDELYVWSGSISERAVYDLYNNGFGKLFYDPYWTSPLASHDSNLVAAWDFERAIMHDENEIEWWNRQDYSTRQDTEAREDLINRRVLIPNVSLFRAAELDPYHESLVGAWTFNETSPPVYDQISDQDLALSGDAEYNEYGHEDILGLGVSLRNTSSSYFYTPATNLPTAGSPRTMAMWVYISDLSGDYREFFWYGNTTDEKEGFGLGRDSSTGELTYYRSPAGGVIRNTFTGLEIPYYRWIFLALVYDGTTMTAWLNEKKGIYVAPIDTEANTVLTVAGGMSGRLGELWAWGTNLPDDVVYQIYRQGAKYYEPFGSFSRSGVMRSEGKHGDGIGSRTDSTLSYSCSDEALEITGSKTVSMWVRVLSLRDEGVAHLISKGEERTSDRSHYGISVDPSGNLIGWVSDTNGNKYETQSYNRAVKLQTWQHVVYVFKPSIGAYLYVDGLLVGESTTNVPTSTGNLETSKLYLGAIENEYVEGHFDGKIDEVYIWDTPLDRHQIQELHNDGFGRFYGVDYSLPSGFTYIPSSSSSSTSSSSSSTSSSSTSESSESISSSSSSSSSASSSSSSSSQSSESSSSESGGFGWV